MFKSIRTGTTIVFIALATLPLLLVSLIVGVRGYQQQQQHVLDIQLQLAKSVSADISNFIDGLEKELRIVVEVHGVNRLPAEQQRQILQELLSYEGIFDELTLVDADGAEKVRLSRFTATSATVLGNRANAPEFTTPKITRNAYYSPVSFNEVTGEPRMTIAVPLLDQQGQFIGALISDARIKKIWDLINSLQLGVGDSVYIVDSQNRVIAHRNPALVLKGTFFTVPTQSGFQKGLEADNVFLVTENIKFGEQVFSVVTEKLASEALAPALNTLLLIALLTVGVSIAASLAGLLAVRQVLQPIQTLARATQSISKGDLSQEVKATSQDEIGELAHAFDSMRRQLQQTLEGLEHRVSDRTRDLQIAADVSRQITRVLDINELLEQVVTLAAQRFNYYAASVFLMDQEHRQLVYAARASATLSDLTATQVKVIPLDAEPSLIALAARTRHAVVIGDIRTETTYMPDTGLPDTRSELAIPMLLGERVLGIFDVQSETVNRFRAEDLNVLTTLADQIGIAVRNAQLFAETKEARQEAERSNNVKSQFLASMSHELRTPLNAILNFTQFVSSGMMGEVNEEQVEALGNVVTSAQHLLNLINDVLDISKIESGALNLYLENNISIPKAVDWAAKMAEPLLSNKPITLSVDVGENLPLITGDERRIRQILLNLVSNACKFTRDGNITISAHQQNGDILLCVRDTGPGIAPEDHKAVFEIFRQTETGLRHGGGTGLGLPISLRLAEAHGGRLWLESTPGEGAAFYVALPVKSSLEV